MKSFEFSPNSLDHFGPTQGPDISLPLIGRRLVYPNSCLLMQCVPNGNRYYWDINWEKILFFYKLHCQYSFLVICQNFFNQKKKSLLLYRICRHNIGMDPYPMTKGCHQACSFCFFACNSSNAWGIFKWCILQGFLDDLSVCTLMFDTKIYSFPLLNIIAVFIYILYLDSKLCMQI